MLSAQQHGRRNAARATVDLFAQVADTIAQDARALRRLTFPERYGRRSAMRVFDQHLALRIRMPLKNASGSQISEQMLCQKLSRIDNLLMNASILSNNRWAVPGVIGRMAARTSGGTRTGSRGGDTTSSVGKPLSRWEESVASNEFISVDQNSVIRLFA